MVDVMSILNYFKRVDGLPDSQGLPSGAMSSAAIASANKEVERVMAEANSTQPKKYKQLSNRPMNNTYFISLLAIQISSERISLHMLANTETKQLVVSSPESWIQRSVGLLCIR